MKIKALADLVGLSVRTLRHYDELGLLKPDQISAAGYRLYSADNLAQLQQILFFRELGFPLAQIKSIVNDPAFDRLQALEQHQRLLVHKQRRLSVLLQTLEHTIRDAKGELKMPDSEKFQGFAVGASSPTLEAYTQEARQRWGDAAVEASHGRLAAMQAQGFDFQGAMNALYTRLADLRHGDPGAPEAQSAIAEWYVLLSRVGHYSPAAFKGLGQMYVDDARFTRNIDQFGDGLAVFLRDAMAIYAEALATE